MYFWLYPYSLSSRESTYSAFKVVCLIEVPWETGYEVAFDGVIGQSTGSSVLDDNGLNDQVHHKVASHEVAVPHGLTYIMAFFSGQKAPQQL